MRPTWLIPVLLLASLPSFAQPAPGPTRRRLVMRADPNLPLCASVDGIPAVAVSSDGGKTVLPHREPASGYGITTYGVTPLSTPGTLLATPGRLLTRSTDSGCSWRIDHRIVFNDEMMRLIALPDGAALAWTTQSAALIRIGPSILTRTLPTTRPVDLSAGRANPNELALADATGAIWWSDDEGATWLARPGAPAPTGVASFDFSATDRRHAVAGTIGDGARVTYDGATWENSGGTALLTISRVAISPVDSRHVWAVGADPLGSGPGRHVILSSNNSGRLFAPVLRGSTELPLASAFTLAPHPEDPTLLYFGLPGSTLVLMDRFGGIHQRTAVPYPGHQRDRLFSADAETHLPWPVAELTPEQSGATARRPPEGRT